MDITPRARRSRCRRPRSSTGSPGPRVADRRWAPWSPQPLLHRHGRPPADRGLDVELVGEPLDTGQPQAEAAGGGEAALQGLGDVGDPRTVVAGHHPDSAPAVPLDALQDDPPAL